MINQIIAMASLLCTGLGTMGKEKKKKKETRERRREGERGKRITAIYLGLILPKALQASECIRLA